jgi:hypothetical protein
MPMNIVQMQKQLEMLPDQALAGYVQRPSGEVPQYLVLSELGRRQKLRQSSAGGMGGAQPPKSTVKDDLLSQGLGSMPVQAPGAEQAYAAGGIVSFADGGDVDYGTMAAEGLSDPYGVGTADSGPLSDLASKWWELAKTPYQAIGRGAKAAGQTLYPEIFGKPAPAAPAGTGKQKDVFDAISAASGNQAPTPAMPAAQAAPSGRVSPSGASGIASLGVSARSKTPGAGGKVAGPSDTTYKPITTEDQIANAKKIQEALGSKGEFAEDRARLEEERQAILGRKQSNINEAMIQAGLGMMAGKSQYAMQNIGEGGMQGLAYLNKANQQDDAARRALISEQNAITKAEAAMRRGDQQTAMGFATQAEKDKQFAVTAAQQKENYLLAHQDRQQQINATLRAASMRVSQGNGTKQDALALKAANMAEGSAKAWLASNKGNPEYLINPGKLEQDYQQKLMEGYTRAYAVIGKEAPEAIGQTAAPKATMAWDPKANKLVPIQ